MADLAHGKQYTNQGLSVCNTESWFNRNNHAKSFDSRIHKVNNKWRQDLVYHNQEDDSMTRYTE